MVLGVGYRKQCEEKAVQCLNRLNIGLGAGTGRLQKRWGGRLSSAAVALAAAALHPHLARAGLLLRTLPRALPQHRWASPSLFGEFLVGPRCVSQHHPFRRSPHPHALAKTCPLPDPPRGQGISNLAPRQWQELVLPLTRTTSGASTSLKPSLLGPSPITQAQPHLSPPTMPCAACTALAFVRLAVP